MERTAYYRYPNIKSRDYIARYAAIPSLAKSFDPSLAGLETVRESIVSLNYE
ncbi:hypothetical protein SAMN05444359_10986 [Neolewinella agarilytica]|uniref:Uncharacterized protein n=1 Tax=Neolewinella agarilytica TaxID=478744 RepID=A0A1H9FTU7_9BACT|nr:hypothetical protein SAMN05444359_10986 [Neolewinella agarilytica]